MKQTRWLFHPITVFIFSILALGLSLALYIYWYIGVSSGLQALADRLNIAPDQVLEPRVWLVILVLSILVGIILMGIFTIFVYNHARTQNTGDFPQAVSGNHLQTRPPAGGPVEIHILHAGGCGTTFRPY